MVDEERMKAGHWVRSVLCVSFSVLTGRTYDPYMCHLSPTVSLLEQVEPGG